MNCGFILHYGAVAEKRARKSADSGGVTASMPVYVDVVDISREYTEGSVVRVKDSAHGLLPEHSLQLIWGMIGKHGAIDRLPVRRYSCGQWKWLLKFPLR